MFLRTPATRPTRTPRPDLAPVFREPPAEAWARSDQPFSSKRLRHLNPAEFEADDPDDDGPGGPDGGGEPMPWAV